MRIINFIVHIFLISLLLISCSRKSNLQEEHIYKVILEDLNQDESFCIKSRTIKFPSHLKKMIKKDIYLIPIKSHKLIENKRKLLSKVLTSREHYQIDYEIDNIKVLSNLNFFFDLHLRQEEYNCFYQFSNIIFDNDHQNALVYLKRDYHDFFGSSHLIFLNKSNGDWLIEDRLLMMIK